MYTLWVWHSLAACLTRPRLGPLLLRIWLSCLWTSWHIVHNSAPERNAAHQKKMKKRRNGKELMCSAWNWYMEKKKEKKKEAVLTLWCENMQSFRKHVYCGWRRQGDSGETCSLSVCEFCQFFRVVLMTHDWTRSPQHQKVKLRFLWTLVIRLFIQLFS